MYYYSHNKGIKRKCHLEGKGGRGGKCGHLPAISSPSLSLSSLLYRTKKYIKIRFLFYSL